MRIYFAAPLDSEEARETNERLARDLRRMGHTVFLPQEHGVGDVKLQGLDRESEEYWKKRHELWSILYQIDMVGLKACDCVVAISTKEDGHLSAGMIWEMGWATGHNIPVFLCTQGLEDKMDYSLMVMHSVDMSFQLWSELLQWLKFIEKEGEEND